MLRIKWVSAIGVCLLAVVLTSLLPIQKVFAAKDSKKPTIKVRMETEEVTADSVKMTVTVTDNVGVVEFRYASGARNTAYFRDQGKGKVATLKNDSRTFNIKENKTYTFYAVDAAGNTRIKQVTVSNIDKEAPVLSVKAPDIDGYTNSKQYFTIKATDDLSGIAVLKYAYGVRDAAYFSKKGTEISLSKKGNGKAVIKKNSDFTFYIRDKVGHETTYVTSVSFLDLKAPTCKASYSVSRQTASVKLSVKDDLSGVARIQYQAGSITSSAEKDWKEAKELSSSRFQVKKAGDYTIRVTDGAGNVTLTPLNIQIEFRAAWITYIEYAPSFKYTKYTYNTFKNKIDKMFDTCVEENLNAVVVQVRPFSDALYESDYFPWSGYISGEQGKDPGFDPMEYMIEAAHKRGLEFHAYLNPYRVEAKANYKLLSDDNPAKRWLEDDDDTNDRNVLLFGEQYYYNPAVEEVRKLIVDGVREIVERYDVDGIHFDDYFYPTLGTKYKSNFDYLEYKEYAAVQKASGLKADSIDVWRRNNVSTLISEVYAAVKKADSSVVFGISPAGNLNNLRANDRYYVDIDLWLSEPGYVDYICPQIYWGFEHGTCPFAETTDKWADLITTPEVNLYVGLALYKAGTNDTSEWKNNDDIIARQVKYLRDGGFADGFFLYRYDFLTTERSKKEMKNLRKLLQ